MPRPLIIARFALLSLGLLALLAGCVSRRDDRSVAASVVTTSGAVRGERADGLVIHRGIPFAAAPVGGLRWKPPQTAPVWTGVRDARVFAPACIQDTVSMPGETPPPISEDCLYLNIWAPEKTPKAGAPVLVWIHGGGYSSGAAAMPLYHGDRLAKRGVVVVTLAYRLGPLGFLAHPELTAESPDESSGNYALMDQIAALEWVRDNIAAFGGDPGQVTIAGQSAGAMSVSLLLASPRAKGLVHRAIGQSGGVFEPLQLAPGYLLANAERDGERYAASVGAASLADLRALPAARLLGGEAGRITHPVIGPGVLPLSPYQAYTTGRHIDVPLLVGANAEEARSLADVRAVTAASFAGDLEKAWGPLPPSIVAGYPFATDEEARAARLDLERDLRFGWDMWAWARLQAQSGGEGAWYYSFDQRPPFPDDSVHAGWGASHFAELWYMFDHLDQSPWAWTAGDRALAADMSAYWTNFVKTGDPNGPGLSPWPRYAGADADVLHLASPVATGGLNAPQGLQAFEQTYTAVRGAPFGQPE